MIRKPKYERGPAKKLAVPVLLDLLQLKLGAEVGVSVESGRLIIEPRKRPHYTLNELLAQCDPQDPLSAEDQTWLTGPPAGSELI